ncbi:MAG: hypothetical protein UY50_C0023G0039 [Parcubacteria group bacterium GW2011_GWA2_49_9]|nr:MAG: hypothetical protein UY50_C0023G0039 [Parcubacteria group bacterium GW2011_GWA2_49_9]
MPPEQFRQPASDPNNELPPQPNTSDELPRIRTYQSDVEEMMQKQHVSKTTIALAEGERARQQEEQVESSSPTKIFSIGNALPIQAHWNWRLILFVVVGIGVGIGIGAYFFFRTTPPPITAPVTQVTPKATTAIALQGKETRAGAITLLRKSIEAISVPQNELRAIPVTIGGATLTTPNLFSLLQATAPSALTRALGNTPVFGLHGFQGGQPFLLFSVSSYDNAFPAMLSFETTLLDDIGPLFGVNPRELLANVGSTTAEALQNQLIFKDVVIRNKDARAAFGPQDAIVFLYSFIDKQTLVLTTNEETLKTLIGKAGGGRLK